MPLVRLVVAAAFALAALSSPAHAAGEDKPIKKLVNAVRYSKDAIALQSLDGPAQGAFLLEGEWEKGTAAQKKEFIELFHALFAGIAFPAIRENLEHLGTTLYDAAKVDGARASVDSTLVIMHALKKQELKLRYDLTKHKAGWQVLDVTVLGTGSNSFLTDIRNDQIRPIMKQGGWDHLLKLMKQRLEQIQSKQKKG